jgi:hypothetical protein
VNVGSGPVAVVVVVGAAQTPSLIRGGLPPEETTTEFLGGRPAQRASRRLFQLQLKGLLAIQGKVSRQQHARNSKTHNSVVKRPVDKAPKEGTPKSAARVQAQAAAAPPPSKSLGPFRKRRRAVASFLPL